MEHNQLETKIAQHIAAHPEDPRPYEDYFSYIRNLPPTTSPIHVSKSKRIRQLIAKAPKPTQQTIERFYMLNRRLLCYEGPEDFDSFMLYNEIDRPLSEQFWYPRRPHLLHICKALEELEYNQLDELYLSMPPRTGKTSLIMLYLAWKMGRDSEKSNLYVSYTESVVKVFYKRLLEILTDPITYRYHDMFPKAKIAGTDAKDLLINIERQKGYASFTGRSLYGTLNGACDCNGSLIGDDLISGIEEARSKDRLDTAWTTTDNNMIPRAKEGATRLFIGTRWSLIDPAGRRLDLIQNDPTYKHVRYKVVTTPALDPKTDESNFAYPYGVGFSTEYFRQRRASFERNNDIASWMAQYQGEPIERDGTVFEPDGLRYYNGELPPAPTTPDRIFCVVDPAYGGGDYTAAVIIHQYNDDLYVADVIFNTGEKTITQPLIIQAVKKNNVQAMKVEGTRMTASYGQEIDNRLREEGIRINMQISTSHFTGTGKASRIFDKAPEIREKMIFLSEGHRQKEYQQFMTNMYSFTVTGKNKHDDAPDVCAMAIDFAYHSTYKAEVFSRPW